MNSEAKLGLCPSSFFSRRYDCAGSRPFCCQTRPRPETAGPHMSRFALRLLLFFRNRDSSVLATGKKAKRSKAFGLPARYYGVVADTV